MPTPVVDLTDFDEVIVDRACSNRWIGRVPTAEAVEATRRLARRGFNDGQIAHRLQASRRSVVRWRQRTNTPPALPIGSNTHDRLVDAPSRPLRLG